MRLPALLLPALLVVAAPVLAMEAPPAISAKETATSGTLTALKDDGTWFMLPAELTTLPAQHLRHAELFGPFVKGTYNEKIMAGIDKVQSTAPDGGGYFIGIKAVPTESPVGYPLSLFGAPLLEPPRTTSYCSGVSYTAFIEALNLIYPEGARPALSPERAETLRMQEPDGGRREDRVKFWGKWNDDGFGSHYALVQYAGMGEEVKPANLRPGDFVNISWNSGGGHSVVFLGWHKDDTAATHMLYWSSQGATNGIGDQLVPTTRIRHIKSVRLTKPENLFTFDIEAPVQRKIPADKFENLVIGGE